MSNVFEVLKRMGGVVVENGVTYVTHPNPPANDDSQKIATTAWVKDITDALEASVSGGMFPKVSQAVVSGNVTYAPSGGTWWCVANYESSNSVYVNGSISGGGYLRGGNYGKDYFCIKIA